MGFQGEKWKGICERMCGFVEEYAVWWEEPP